MNSRECVLAALNHQPPQRVPVDFGGHRSSGISAIAYAKLKKALRVNAGDIYVYDIPQQLAIIEPEVMDVLGVDAIELGRGFLTEAKDWRPWTLPDGTACKIPVYVNLERDGENTYALAGDGTRLAVQRKGCLYFEQCFWPMADRPFGADDFADVPWALSKNMFHRQGGIFLLRKKV
jgi:uroporphyrinogen decarboxylase